MSKQTLNSESARAIAQRIFNANLKRDHTLYALLLKPYPIGSVGREQIDAELRCVHAEHRSANAPCYFR